MPMMPPQVRGHNRTAEAQQEATNRQVAAAGGLETIHQVAAAGGLETTHQLFLLCLRTIPRYPKYTCEYAVPLLVFQF